MRALLARLRGLVPAPPSSGARAEALAAETLAAQGWRVLARNWRNPADRREELDLVCADGDVLVFVEVKARSARALVPGYFAVDRRKKKVLLQAARAYLRGLRHPPRTVRFDVVEVALGAEGPAGGPGEPALRHFENVPLFPRHFRGA
ncbi:MAG: YraN family protein [Verrucomicrobia bacterium]|nr:YraN family protein [Verrucomicrobiota bacterium]